MIPAILWKRVVTRLARPAMLALMLTGLAAGCATTRGPGIADIEVQATADDAFYIGEQRVPLARLSRELKSRGAGRQTAVHVEIPQDFGTLKMKRITETLVQGGLPRVVFTKPRRATAEVDAGP